MELILSLIGSVRGEGEIKLEMALSLSKFANTFASNDFSNLKTGFFESLKIGLDRRSRFGICDNDHSDSHIENGMHFGF